MTKGELFAVLQGMPEDTEIWVQMKRNAQPIKRVEHRRDLTATIRPQASTPSILVLVPMLCLALLVGCARSPLEPYHCTKHYATNAHGDTVATYWFNPDPITHVRCEP